MLAGLIEADVAIVADSQQLQVNAARLPDGSIVGAGGSLRVGGVSIRDVDVFRRHVDMAEQLLPHEEMVGAGMLRRKALVFIQIEADGPGKIKITRLVHGNQVLVGAHGRGAGGKAKNAVRLVQQLCGHQRSGCMAHLLRRIKNMDLHGALLLVSSAWCCEYIID